MASAIITWAMIRFEPEQGWLDWITFPFVFSTSFALLSKLVDSLAIHSINKTTNKAVNSVYCDNAKDKLKLIKGIINKSPINEVGLDYALNDLQAILNSMCKCCMGEKKKELDDHIEVISATKLQIQKKKFDDNIVIQYGDILQDLEGINRTLLNH